jgi:hypothetical protein
MRSWLTRLFSCGARKQPAGIELDPHSHWEISAPKEHAPFLRCLIELLPPGAILYLEGTSIAHDVSDFLAAHAVESPTPVRRGTIWPMPAVHHVPATAANTEALASLIARHPAPEICDHLHAYVGSAVILQWHDAFFDDPLLLSSRVPEDAVKRFCQSLGCSYKRIEAGKERGEMKWPSR